MGPMRRCERSHVLASPLMPWKRRANSSLGWSAHPRTSPTKNARPHTAGSAAFYPRWCVRSPLAPVRQESPYARRSSIGMDGRSGDREEDSNPRWRSSRRPGATTWCAMAPSIPRPTPCASSIGCTTPDGDASSWWPPACDMPTHGAVCWKVRAGPVPVPSSAARSACHRPQTRRLRHCDSHSIPPPVPWRRICPTTTPSASSRPMGKRHGWSRPWTSGRSPPRWWPYARRSKRDCPVWIGPQSSWRWRPAPASRRSSPPSARVRHGPRPWPPAFAPC
jgi:hypothetical protein